MTDRFRWRPALTFLAALSALASPGRVQAAPSTPAAAAPQRPSPVLEVADQGRHHRDNKRRGQRSGDAGNTEVERLNEMSLQRAQQGQNAPGPGPDTTSNLNRMSEQDAERGRNTGGRPVMPFR